MTHSSIVSLINGAYIECPHKPHLNSCIYTHPHAVTVKKNQRPYDKLYLSGNHSPFYKIASITENLSLKYFSVIVFPLNT